MRLAAIDIGSNAIRLQVVRVGKGENPKFKKVEFIRFPLRLGHDVFNLHRISRQAESKLVRLMKTFKLLLELYEVDDYLAYATSAMREAENGEEIAQRIYYRYGLKIHIIDGNKEAEVINLAIQDHLDNRNFIHIDVGGGSTELNVYANKEKIAARSFKIGGVRRLEDEKKTLMFEKMQKWLEEVLLTVEKPMVAVGTGGNINKLYSLSEHKEDRWITLEELRKTRELVESYSVEDRMNILQLNRDRADVIIPASDIYFKVIEITGASDILVPGVGLKDGMILKLYKENLQRILSSEEED